MPQHLNFSLDYFPTVEAAECDVRNAEVDYENARNKEFGGYGGTWPHLENLERFRAARERLHHAQAIAREARHRELGKKVGAIWS